MGIAGPKRRTLDDGLRRTRAICRASFYEFVKRAWRHVFGIPFTDGRHIEEICKHLQLMAEGFIDFLVINIPPGHGKSLLCSVLYPAWRFGPRGEKMDWLTAALTEKLATRDTEACREVMKSRWFQELWPLEFSGSVDAKSLWKLIGGGKRDTTSVRAKGTGLRAHFQLLDDPHEITESITETKRTIRWINETWGSRDNLGSVKAQSLMIMQRVGTKDATGQWLEKNLKDARNVHLCLPLEYDPAHHCVTPYGGDWRTKPGQLLWPEGCPPNYAADKRRDVGPRRFAAIFNQRPVADGGREFQPDWLGHRWRRLIVEKVERWGVSIDASFKDGPSADSVSIQLIAKIGPFYYIVDEISDTMSWTTLKRRAMEFVQQWRNRGVPVLTVLIEEAANGWALKDEFERTVTGGIGFKPKGDKVNRARSTTGIWEAGQVLLPADGAILVLPGNVEHEVHPKWTADYETQFLDFPEVEHDDSVDATTQWIIYCETGISVPEPDGGFQEPEVDVFTVERRPQWV